MARPKKEIDAETVRKLALIHCTVEEIASVVGCSKDTLERRFAATIKEGRNHGKASLRREMWKAATEKGNITMMIWLSKQLLGMTDKIEEKQTLEANHTVGRKHKAIWGGTDEPNDSGSS